MEYSELGTTLQLEVSLSTDARLQVTGSSISMDRVRSLYLPFFRLDRVMVQTLTQACQLLVHMLLDLTGEPRAYRTDNDILDPSRLLSSDDSSTFALE